MTATNAYAAYQAARNDGWTLVSSFHERVGSTHPEMVAREDNLSQEEVNLLLRIHHRIKPCDRLATDLKLSLDHLNLVSVALGKVDKKLNNLVQILEKILIACTKAHVEDD